MTAVQPENADTLPKLLLAQVARWGDRRVAIREKEFGIWQSHSWQDSARHVERIALGLASLGFRRGDKIAVIGDNRPQLYWTMFAAQALGGAPVPVYQDSIAAEMHYVIDHSESRMVICEDQEQVDKILEMKDKLPAVELVLYDDPKGMRHYDYPFLLSLDRVQELGLRFAAEHEGFWEAEAGKGRASDLAVINYTSGTTGFPKGVMISHGALLSTARSFLEIEPLDERDEIMAYLPMAWIGDSFFSMAVACLAGCTVNCPEDASTVRQDFREIGPTMTFAPPRIWENILSQSQVRIEDADRLQRALTKFFLPLGMRKAKLELEGQPVPARLRALCAIGRWLVFEPLRDQLGLRRVRVLRPRHPPSRRAGQAGDGGRAPAGSGDHAVAAGRGADPLRWPLLGLLQEPGADRRGPPGRVAPHRGRRALRSRRAPRDHRPREGRGQAPRRHGLCAPVHREQAQVQRVRERGGGRREPAPLHRSHDQYRHGSAGPLGGATRPRLHGVYRPRPEPRHLSPHPGGDPPHQRDLGPLAARQAVRHPPQGARSGRRRDHENPQAPPRVHP